ncbi:MAG: adenylosuccinate lyase [Alloprevotella sp.]|nr:adenylosuccinate lyase [Alloprevotella sp.]
MEKSLLAVSPIDGRYAKATAQLSDFFSEKALIKYRLFVEIEYFIYLSASGLTRMRQLSGEETARLRSIYETFSLDDAKHVKEIESVTNHDVKAVEYFIKEKLDAIGGFQEEKECVHFGLTSQDINNTAFPLMLKDALSQCIIPSFSELIEQVKAKVEEYSDISMLARTHGQPASPTRLGKEFDVFRYRLEQQLAHLILANDYLSGKFGGATGNFNAHRVAYPKTDWPAFANQFLTERLHIRREAVTTQISNYDSMSAVFDALKRLATIVVDFDRDVWQYISMGYFQQRIKAGEVGSSAMPHKVNPIDFENSEGNLMLAVSTLEFLSRKLPVSRLQRDLTDSTVIRNIGVPLAHILIGLKSTLKGLGKLLVNREAIGADLDNNWAVVAEAIQTILRREGYPNPYETLKALTRTNEKITQARLEVFIDGLEVAPEVKDELRKITPHNYVGF